MDKAFKQDEASYLVGLMNEIYRDYWNPLHNYFLPSFKLEKKIRVGGRIKKVYDRPQTPAQRLLNYSKTAGDKKRKVQSDIARLDSIELKEGLEKKLTEFYTALKRVKMLRDKQVA